MFIYQVNLTLNLLSLQVLPRENGVHYPWNFIFSKSFWKKKTINTDQTATLDVNINDEVSIQKMGFPGKDNIKPSVETISLDMKQQELDSRYTFKKFDFISNSAL